MRLHHLEMVLALSGIARLCHGFARTTLRTGWNHRPNISSRTISPFSVLLKSTNISSSSAADIASMKTGELRKELESYGINTRTFLEKREMVEALQKARADGLQPIRSNSNNDNTPASTTAPTSSPPTSSSSTAPSTTPTPSAGSSDTTKMSREERLKQEILACQAIKAVDLKKELEERGVSTKSFFEKSEFVQALAAARVDGVTKGSSSKGASSSGDNDGDDKDVGYAEYTNVEVLTDANAGPREKFEKRKTKPATPGNSNPFGAGMGGSPFGGGGGGGANPFGVGMGGMGGIADILKNMGMGGNPGGGGGGGDVFGKAQQMMSNPKVQELLRRAQSNPSVMAKVQECMSNPAAMMKYKNDPEVSEILAELKRYM